MDGVWDRRRGACVWSGLLWAVAPDGSRGIDWVSEDRKGRAWDDLSGIYGFRSSLNLGSGWIRRKSSSPPRHGVFQRLFRTGKRWCEQVYLRTLWALGGGLSRSYGHGGDSRPGFLHCSPNDYCLGSWGPWLQHATCDMLCNKALLVLRNLACVRGLLGMDPPLTHFWIFCRSRFFSSRFLPYRCMIFPIDSAGSRHPISPVPSPLVLRLAGAVL